MGWNKEMDLSHKPLRAAKWGTWK